MSHSAQPLLDVRFKAGDNITTDIVKSLYDQLDHRTKGAKNWKASHAVICGILALRYADSFKASRAIWDDAHKAAFDSVTECLTGTLLQRVSGQNVYRVHPHFDGKNALVVDTRPADFRFRVSGYGVSYASQDAIQNPHCVSLMNGQHAVALTLTDVGRAIEHQYRQLPFPPNYFDALDQVELSWFAEEITASYRDYIRHILHRFGYVGILVNGTNDNAFEFVVLDQYAHEFPAWLYQVSLPFWRSQRFPDGRGVKSVLFPATIYRKDGRVHQLRGQAIQALQEKSAGVA